MLDRFMKRDKESAPLNIKTYFKATVCLASLAAVLRTLAYFTSFDSEIGYFNESFFVTLVNWLIAVTCIFVLSGFVFISKDADLSHKTDNGANSIFFSATFAGFILLADFAYKIITIAGAEKFSYYKMIFSSAYRSDNAYIIRVTAIIEILGVLASLLAAACFFVRASKKPNAKLSAWLGFFPIIRALVGVAQMYFDMTVQMNHPSKLMLQFALISVMFYFLCEEREYVSEQHARPRRFFISGCLAYLLSFAGGFSEVVGFFTGKLSEGAFCVEAFLCFILSFYILARINSFVRCMPAKSSAEVVAEELSTETVESEASEEKSDE
jgi:hypothetical protein